MFHFVKILWTLLHYVMCFQHFLNVTHVVVSLTELRHNDSKAEFMSFCHQTNELFMKERNWVVFIFVFGISHLFLSSSVGQNKSSRSQLSDVSLFDKVGKALALESGELGSSPDPVIYCHSSLRQVTFVLGSFLLCNMCMSILLTCWLINMIMSNEFKRAL